MPDSHLLKDATARPSADAGNADVTVKVLAPAARAPGRDGGVRAASLLSPDLSFTERACADFRAWLDSEGLESWPIFFVTDDELYELDPWLGTLDAEAHWEPAPPLTGGGGRLLVKNDDHDAMLPGHLFEPGFLLLREWQVAAARWYWVSTEYGAADSMWLVAARDNTSYQKLRDHVKALRHKGNRSVWQIVRGHANHDGPRRRRSRKAGRELILPEPLVKQVERDVVGFFKPEVRRLYRKLKVPYRRGVLLHGPPGNGKTSLIRMAGAALPRLPFLLCRPDRRIDGGALRVIVDRWQRQAPAVLVIEDLNWLLEHVDVSQFLNLIDGIERQDAKGLLLLATTNYPEKLDPAVNNRPGRFDVVVELPNPDGESRVRFFDKNLPDLADEDRRQAARKSDGLSFAHLREVLRLSGLIAIENARESRTGEDLLRAVDLVHDSHDRAVRGFPRKPELPFGLQHPRRD